MRVVQLEPSEEPGVMVMTMIGYLFTAAVCFLALFIYWEAGT